VQDSAIQFTASDKAYLSVASNSSLQTGDIDFEIGCWVYLDSTSTKTIAGKWDYGKNEYIFYVVSGKFTFSVTPDGSASTTVTANTFGNLSTSVWYFVRCWNDSVGNVIGISVNGISDTVSYSSGVYIGTSAFCVGYHSAADLYFSGRVDSLYLAKRIFSAAEATWMYNAGAGRIYNDLTDSIKTSMVSWWDFNEENGTRYDSHSTNHLAQTFVNIIDSSTPLLNGGFESLGTGETLGSELLSNTGFETAGGGGADVFANWTEYTSASSLIELDTSTFHGGANSVKLTEGAADYAAAIQSFTATPSARYKLTFWTRGDATYAGRYNIWNLSNGSDIVALTSTSVTSATWTQVTKYFTVPVGCTSVGIYLVSPSTTGGIAYFDDVSLKAVTASATFANWTELYVGGSYGTITADTSAPNAGTYDALFAVDAGGLYRMALYQNVLTSGHKYKTTYYAKANSGTPSVEYLMGGNSGTGSTGTQALTTSYAQYTHYATSDGAGFYIGPDNAAGSASKSFYLDDVTLVCTEIPSAAGITAGWAKDGNLCASFNGTSQYLLYTGNAFDPGTSDYSVGCYANATKLGTYMLMGGGNAGFTAYWSVYITPSGTVSIEFTDGSGAALSASSSAGIVKVNEWHYYVADFDRDSNLTIYMDGVSVLTKNISTRAGSCTFGSLGVGIYGSNINFFFAGRIGQAFYKQRLTTANERTALFNNGIGLRGASELPSTMTADVATCPMSYWPLEEYSAGTANITRSDAIGANHLTSVGNTPSGQGVDYYGGAVSKWYDLSGNNRTFTQTTIASRLLYSGATIGNKYSIVGDNGTKCLSYASDFIGTGDVTLFAVIKPRGWGGGGYGRIFDTGQQRMYVGPTGFIQLDSNAADSGCKSSNSSIALDTASVVSATRTSAGAVNFYINGVLSGTANQNSNSPQSGTVVYLFNRATPDRGFDGWLQKLIIVNGILSQSKIQAVSQQLMRENGI
jgi:hypothetical protein